MPELCGALPVTHGRFGTPAGDRFIAMKRCKRFFAHQHHPVHTRRMLLRTHYIIPTDYNIIIPSRYMVYNVPAIELGVGKNDRCAPYKRGDQLIPGRAAAAAAAARDDDRRPTAGRERAILSNAIFRRRRLRRRSSNASRKAARRFLSMLLCAERQTVL